MRRYQRLPEDFYEIIRRRKLRVDQVGFAIYLRGKSCRFGNPFKLSNSIICYELNITEKVLRRLRDTLQTKGILKYDSGIGKKYTIYSMIDSLMIQSRGTQTGTSEVSKRAPLGYPNGHLSIYKNIDKKVDKKENTVYSSSLRTEKRETPDEYRNRIAERKRLLNEQAKILGV